MKPPEASEDSALFSAIDDGASYIDAATVALRLASTELGSSDQPVSFEDKAEEVTPAVLRDTMGRLVTGVCVVTLQHGHEDVAMTVNSVTSLSLNPPLLLVCIARSARFHDLIVNAEGWGLSILDAGAVDISRRFARPNRGMQGQFDALAHHRGPVTGVALLDAACASLECRMEVVHPGGDHSIVVGRVIGVERQRSPRHPLVYHRGRYAWLHL